MRWVTRKHIRVNRAATAWLVRRFIDPDAAFEFTEPEQVAVVQRDTGAVGFDAPGARYPHIDTLGRCSFEALVAEHCASDPVLRRLALIVGSADLPDAIGRTPEGAGLKAISRGFPLVSRDDLETLERASFLYDALYASLEFEERERAASDAPHRS
jgi:hypothetical protein